jgi:hypothetical protein
MKNFKIALILGFLMLGEQSFTQRYYISSLPDLGGQPTNYLGNPVLDQNLNNEYAKLVYCFGVRPCSYYILENGGSNAFATPSLSREDYPDGTVVLGLNLINKECSESVSGTCISVAVIMAHEFAHILDFKYRYVNQRGKMPELFADYMAGVYLYTRELTYSFTDIKEAANSIFTKGDTDFNSPLHHGTSQERMNALLAGYNFSKKIVASGRYNFTIQEAMRSAKEYLKF